MSLKDTIILGTVGAAAIYIARKVPTLEIMLDGAAPSNGKTVPIVGSGPMVKNGWSAVFWIAPAAAAWYLSR